MRREGHVNRDLLGFTVMTAFPSYEARYIVLEFGSRPSIKTEVLITLISYNYIMIDQTKQRIYRMLLE